MLSVLCDAWCCLLLAAKSKKYLFAQIWSFTIQFCGDDANYPPENIYHSRSPINTSSRSNWCYKPNPCMTGRSVTAEICVGSGFFTMPVSSDSEVRQISSLVARSNSFCPESGYSLATNVWLQPKEKKVFKGKIDGRGMLRDYLKYTCCLRVSRQRMLSKRKKQGVYILKKWHSI